MPTIQDALKAIEEGHCDKFAKSWLPSLQAYSRSLTRSERQNFLADIVSNSKEQRYQRFSEISMHAYLSRHFERVESGGNIADFHLPDHSVFIEVVTPGPGPDDVLVEYVRETENYISVRNVPCDRIVRRHWDAISAKIQTIRKKEIPAGSPIIIAVSSILLSHFPQRSNGLDDYSFPYIARAVFPVGGPTMWFEPKSRKTGSGHAAQHPVMSLKDVPRQKNYFCDTSYADISAVISISPDEDWFSDWRPIVVRNPYATIPIEIGFFPNNVAQFEIEKTERGHSINRLLK